ncbi:DoxX family protein [Chryseolinea sp. T2]|uniref:DoxX family protein n=1 Tax=Chryseolinea sp. T2 TaxID=3129255 RepID=UPI0030789B3C
MKQLLFYTGNEWMGLVIRLTVALVMLPHGCQKMFGWFGGYGYKATMDFFINSMKLPWTVSVLIIIIEFFGPIGLVVGFASKIWAAALITIMIGAIVTTNLKNGFFMNWFGNQSGEGYEYHLLVIGICLAIIMNGSGRLSIDGLLLQ